MLILWKAFLKFSKRGLIFILLFSSHFYLIVQHTYGQDQKVADSLVLIYQADTIKGLDKLKLLSELSFNELNDRELSHKYAEELVTLSEAENNSTYLLRGYSRTGYYHLFNGDLELALEAFFNCARVAVETEHKNSEATTYLSIADVYSKMESRDNAEL